MTSWGKTPFRRIGLAAASASLSLLAALLGPVHTALAASADAVTIRFDATPAHGDRWIGDPVPVGEWSEVPEFNTYEGWADIADIARQVYPGVSQTNCVAAMGAVDPKGRVGLEVVNLTAAIVQLRIETRLPPGLWRADAALLRKSAGAKVIDSDPALWRMESILRSDTGVTTKRIPLAANQVLFLRWTETGADAREARRAVRRACWTTADRALQDRVSGALMPVDDILDALPTLIERGDRPKITRRIHTALLAIAKAQALWDNGRSESVGERDSTGDRDAAFINLITALSEVSCAAFDLVPIQTVAVSTTSGKPELRVGLTNAGSRTIPLVSLGIENADGSAPASDRTVYRDVAPGATVIARFPVSDPATANGVVQFISDMGAATVAAAPAAPPWTPPVSAD